MEADLFDDNATTEKTQERYKIIYETFVKWKQSNGFNSFDEDVFLAYFNEASKTYKSSTLKSMYSILKRMCVHFNKIDITPYNRLLDLIKEHQVTTLYERRKCKVFTAEEINRFMVEAPDKHYLAMKVSNNRQLFDLKTCRFHGTHFSRRSLSLNESLILVCVPNLIRVKTESKKQVSTILTGLRSLWKFL